MARSATTTTNSGARNGEASPILAPRATLAAAGREMTGKEALAWIRSRESWPW
jgi:hypothetical protein